MKNNSKKRLILMLYYLAWAVGIVAALVLIYGIFLSLR
jgi:predicted nucleic acid-binding Zn ribbon protein